MPNRILTALAWVNVILHFGGLVLAAIGMRPGTPAVPLEERIAYLATSPVSWVMGWVVWMLCAVALIAFLAVLVQRLGEPAPLAWLGLNLALIGIAFDLFCDSIYIIAFPMVAAMQPVPTELFLVLERICGMGSLIIANGLYSTGVLLVTLEMRRRPNVSPITTGLGLGVAGFGLLMAAAGYTGVAWHVEVATGPTMILFCLWVVMVARSFEPRQGTL